jgi:hypothetical protein
MITFGIKYPLHNNDRKKFLSGFVSASHGAKVI